MLRNSVDRSVTIDVVPIKDAVCKLRAKKVRSEAGYAKLNMQRETSWLL